MRTIFAIDFDGTLAEHRFPEIGPAVPGAFEWLKRLQDAGALLILLTMRSDGRTGAGRENGPVLTEAVEFCRRHGVEFWAVNDNPEQHAWTGSRKVYAHAYIDDAALGCPLRESKASGRPPFVDWEKVGPLAMQMVEQRKAAFGAGD